MVEHQVIARPGDDGGELLQELDRVEEQMRGAIAPDRFEFDEDAPIRTELDAVLRERRAEEIAAELFEAGTVVGRDPDVGVEIEAVELGLPRSARGGVTDGSSPRRRTRAPARGPRATRPWTEAPARPARTGEVSLRGSASAPSSSGSSWRLVLAAGEQPPDAGANRGEHLRHLLIAGERRGVKDEAAC
jgi:hypothetical protein